MVVLYHFFPTYFPNGYIGVDAFFVISGFLIAMILTRDEKMNASVLLTFYYRRIKRIMPLYYLVIIGIQLTLLSLLPSTYLKINQESCWRSIALISNIKQQGIDQEYEKMLLGAEDLFTHTWSLSVEMQWYLLAPFVFLALRLVAEWEKLVCVGVLFCSLTFYFYTDDMTAFHSVFARMWQFSCGVIAFLALEHKGNSITPPGNYECVKEEDEEEMDNRVQHYGYLFAAAPGFIWIPCPKHWLRIATTVSFAALIHFGSSYQVVTFSNRFVVYVGDISYALYLIHWPVYVVVNSYSWNPLTDYLAMITISLILANAIHYLFERQYQQWSRNSISAVVIILMATSMALFHKLTISMDYMKEQKFDLANININDSAWNMTLTRYATESVNIRDWQIGNFCQEDLKFREGLHRRRCCSATNGTGTYRILVIGNSFACNQGDLVYNAFRKYVSRFMIVAHAGCEFMTGTDSSYCLRGDFNHTAVLQRTKPDIVFVMSRYFAAKAWFNTTRPISEDGIFQDFMINMNELERITNKVYLLQALPSCVKGCEYKAFMFTKNGRPLRDIKDGLIERDEFYARQRILEVGKRCSKCEIIDYYPLLLDENEDYLCYDSRTNIMLFDDSNHLNIFGKERIRNMFDHLSEKFGKEISHI
ncbi:hypothetical protein Y032_0154g3029 [Ancylostoma ceylanicum]|nr:hypothetical protein Y032_0154g3029 [Ancylostoma ceylanicum]